MISWDKIMCLTLAGIAYAVSSFFEGSAHDGLVFVAGSLAVLQNKPLRKATKAAVVSLVFLSGCATLLPIARSALQALAPVALEALSDVLSGAEPLADAGFCKALPDDYQPDSAAIVACAGEGAVKSGGAASVALTAVSDEAGETVDKETALCERIAPKDKAPVFVCGAMYAEDDE